MRYASIAVLLLALLLPACGEAPAPLTDKTIVASLEKSGLPVKGVVAYTADTDPNKLLGRPNQYAVKVNWGDTRARSGGANVDDGTIEVFLDLDGAKKRAQYIETLGKTAPIFQQYVYVNEKRKAVLRVSHDLTPDQAKAYQDWLAKL
jgi:hypothetical protein